MMRSPTKAVEKSNNPSLGKINSIRLTHNIFSKGQWRKARFLNHPTVNLEISVVKRDYNELGFKRPDINPTKITAMADTGAQSCLWSLDGCFAAGFTESDLIPVSIDLEAANKSPISIAGALLLRLTGTSPTGKNISCATMVYISKQARGFYLSLEAMMDLLIISRDFPSVGEADNQQEVHAPKQEHTNAGITAPLSHADEVCSCPKRTGAPVMPTELPFKCIPENNEKMEQWLLEYFAASTFNTCPHCPLPQMDGPPVEIHLKENAIPTAVHAPAPIPLHYQDQVYADLKRDEALGVIEKVPYGEPVTWCHRMIAREKPGGGGELRRVVAFKGLNDQCT